MNERDDVLVNSINYLVIVLLARQLENQLHHSPLIADKSKHSHCVQRGLAHSASRVFSEDAELRHHGWVVDPPSAQTNKVEN